MAEVRDCKLCSPEKELVAPELAGSVGDLTQQTPKPLVTTALSLYSLPVSFRGLCPSPELHGLLRHSFSWANAYSHQWQRQS